MSDALLTDLYQLTMLQAYHAEGLEEQAVFQLFARHLPPTRNFLLAAGLDDALAYLEELRFDPDALAYLRELGIFGEAFLAWLGELRFEGDVRALPEGTPFFAGEPILELSAPLPVAQLVETHLMNQIHLQTALASKAARIVHAAAGRPVIDFGLRRTHGTDAGLKSARTSYLAGVAATSNVLAGRLYGIPLRGTMAHSYVQVHDDERSAFRSFIKLYPDSVLLVDTYDTLEGVRNVVRLARELGPAFRARAVRLDSGDLARLAREARRILDTAGLHRIEILASGGLDEHRIAALVADGAPLQGFGVGSSMAVSDDAPGIDLVYKLVEYAGTGRIKLSPEKPLFPGRKQVYRVERGGRAERDLVAAEDEPAAGRPLLVPVMERGQRLPAGREDLSAARARAARELARLPERLLALEPADPPYPVETSDALERRQKETAARFGQ